MWQTWTDAWLLTDSSINWMADWMACSITDVLILLVIECWIDSFCDLHPLFSLIDWCFSFIDRSIDWTINRLINWLNWFQTKQNRCVFYGKTEQRQERGWRSHRDTEKRHAASQDPIFIPSDSDSDFDITVVGVIFKRIISWHSDVFDIVVGRLLLRHGRLYHVFSPYSIYAGQADLWPLVEWAREPIAPKAPMLTRFLVII